MSQLQQQQQQQHGQHRPLQPFDAHVLEAYLDDQRDRKRTVFDLFRLHPELLPAETEGMTKEAHRDMVRRQLLLVLDSGVNPLELFAHDLRGYFYLAECFSQVDLSLMVKTGVQYSLWGGSVLNLGTERHRAAYAADIGAFRLPGCFAMTELKHGSNVAALQTEAVLDRATDEWVIHTPDEGAIKWWIGNAAQDGCAATVFARLKLPPTPTATTTTTTTTTSGGNKKNNNNNNKSSPAALEDKGVHAFVVPLRDRVTGALLPGVHIRDCGYKVGLNGVDNGAIRFSHVRVPRGALLDRFASVDASGRYTSPLPTPARRFAATLGELTGGRVGLVCGSVGVAKLAATIAVRYTARRAQFGPPGSDHEVSVLDYQTTQGRLMPLLSTVYGLHFAARFLVGRYAGMKSGGATDPRLVEEVHALSAGLKAYTTSFTQTALGVCREACGGHGYAAVNRLGALRSDHDIFLTFEGDNTVLLQQVTALLLKEYRARFEVRPGGAGPLAASYAFLSQLAANTLPANPLVTHDTDVRHLRDPGFLMKSLEHRTARLLFTLAKRLRKHTAERGAWAAWNACLAHVLALARAYVEGVVHKCFLAAVDACGSDPDVRRALRALADTYALSVIAADPLFRNDDWIAPAKAKAIARLLRDLAAELRGVALPLVDAFAIPDHILRAPIGLSSSVAGASDAAAPPGAAATLPTTSTADASDAADRMYKEYLLAAGFDDV